MSDYPLEGGLDLGKRIGEQVIISMVPVHNPQLVYGSRQD